MNSFIQASGDFFAFALVERMVNKKCALIFMAYSLFNMRINELFMRTMTNGTEAVFTLVAFYYFSKLQYKTHIIQGKADPSKGNRPPKHKIYQHLVFDANMAKMTSAITLAFIVRSSSLIGWVPLALLAIFQTTNLQNILLNLWNISLSGIFVALPLMGFSIAFDSLIYGRFTIP